MIQLLAKLQAVKLVARPRPLTDRAPDREQRSTHRSLSLFWAATLRSIGWTGPVVVVDISAGGMRVRSQLNPSAGTQVIIELPGVTPLRGDVRWSEGDRFGVKLDDEINVTDIMRAHWKATGTHLGTDISV